MSRPDFSELRRILVASTRRALKDFAGSVHNQQVYAVVFDTMEEYGTVILSLNTVSALNNWRKTKYPHYTEDQVTGLFGLKYNPGDFSFVDFGGVANDQRAWANNFEAYLETLKSDNARLKNIERFSDAVAEAMRGLDHDLRLLDVTDDFVAFHCFHDADEETIERLVCKTVSEDRFDRVFPEIRQGRELLANVAKLDINEQAELWVGCFEAYAFGRTNSFATEYFRRNIWLDIRKQIIPIGSAAVPSIMKLLDNVIGQPQFNEKGSDEYNAEGAFTRYSDVSLELLRILRKIGSVNDEFEQKLLDYFRKLYEEAGDGDETIGLNLKWVAATLNSLVPGRYPEPDSLFNENRVRNFRAYLAPN